MSVLVLDFPLVQLVFLGLCPSQGTILRSLSRGSKHSHLSDPWESRICIDHSYTTAGSEDVQIWVIAIESGYLHKEFVVTELFLEKLVDNLRIETI